MEELRHLVRDAIEQGTASGLYGLRLSDCGEFVGQRLRRFETALADHAKAKSAAKRERMGSDARRAGSALISAVDGMKDWQKSDERRDQLFRVGDHISPPYLYSPMLSVTMHFQWRMTVDDQWTHGCIVFTHDADMRPVYERLYHLNRVGMLPKRTSSAAKQKADRQDKLARDWEHLMRGALYSVRDYLERNPDGSTIPASHHSRGTIDNHTTDFWRAPA